jgi:hypothetical protein
MRRSIDGKVYDTNTAEIICDISEGSNGDLDEVNARLYVTKKGAYFIEGHGGPATRFKKGSVGKLKGSFDKSGFVSSKALIPIGLEEARTFCEKFAPHEVEVYFEVEEA